jgi:hypothetical protein
MRDLQTSAPDAAGLAARRHGARMLSSGLARRALLSGGLGLLAWPARAHNNPNFTLVSLLAVDVAATPLEGGEAFTAPFELAPPKRTVELLWRVPAAAPADLRFALLRNGEVVADDLRDGATSRLFRGEGFAIGRVRPAQTEFRLELFASIAEWRPAS